MSNPEAQVVYLSDLKQANVSSLENNSSYMEQDKDVLNMMVIFFFFLSVAKGKKAENLNYNKFSFPFISPALHHCGILSASLMFLFSFILILFLPLS